MLLPSNVSIFDIVSRLHESLDYHLERHNVLATNIAHVDTPGYVPRDLARDNRFARELNVRMEGTHTDHLSSHGNGPKAGRVFEDPSAMVGEDGNAVSLDREAAKAATNQIRYDVVTTLAAAELGALAYVASDARGG